MQYTLAIADRTYSSWSLRGWLLFEKFGLDVKIETARMRLPEFGEMLSDFGLARLVPAMRFDGVAVWDTFAMAETLAEQNPDKGFWPPDPAKRALARSMSAEMHAGFGALREACPMNLRHQFSGVKASEAVLKDLERIELLWGAALSADNQGPWLLGNYSIADVFFAPVATRFVTYGLPASKKAERYIRSHITDPSFRRWRAMGIAENYVQPRYDLDLPTLHWPGPAVLAAKPVTGGRSENSTCPFSGKAVEPDSLAEIDGHIVGFCNQFCRDKAVADPLAWPEVATILSVGFQVQ